MNDIAVEVQQTKNRHSRAVLTEQGIVIRLARGLRAQEEKRHVADLLRRMEPVVRRHRLRTPIDPFRPLFEGTAACRVTLGDGSIIVVNGSPGTKNRLVTASVPWQLTVGAQAHAAHRLLWHALAKQQQQTVEERVRAINAGTLRIPIAGVTLRHASSQWGSCSPRNRICLSSQLLFLPLDLQEYVIIHELAHGIVRNHSARFWALVEAHAPRYREHIRTLRTFRLVPL